MSDEQTFLSLADWRREVAEMYGRVRSAGTAAAAWEDFRSTRDRLFQSHPQSPLLGGQKESFSGLLYYPFEPRYRLVGRVAPHAEPETLAMDLPAEGAFRLRRFASVRFDLFGQVLELALYWVEGYGGGLFLPFRDQTNGQKTFGGGRYLIDTIKGADLGTGDDEIILDFNFAYNPSCAYNDHWVCPLAPPENRLAVDIAAGEMAFPRPAWMPIP